jgi:cellulose synthase/poly-beta-1,6-N-acetylglucosamine synthase-like glycosyltransferase
VRALEWILVVFVLAATLPPIAGVYQFLLAGLHRFHRDPLQLTGRPPRVAVVIPAWNEAAVILRTIEYLLALDYPSEQLRIYVVDDASTDATPEIVGNLVRTHPGTVHHLRRSRGGEGKAHTINYGLREISADGWYEAIMVIDADVIFTSSSLRLMTRHFAHPDVGAVTAYIKEGSAPKNYLNRFIAFEYATAQAGARRAQNMLGAQACLAGGAQLIRRASLEAIGGQIDTSTLAEDTVTTFRIQLAGQRVVFEPYAIVWAEEPREVVALWKQRLRWGRGNVQVTLRFRSVWFHRASAQRLGGISFALIWFSVTLMPVFMVTASASLIALFLLNATFSVHVFRALWFVNQVSYLFVTLSSFSVDPAMARVCWREGIAFPGLISVAIIVWAAVPGVRLAASTPELLFVYAWMSCSMVAAYLVKQLSEWSPARRLIAPLIYVVGYGPLLCAMTAVAYKKELQGAEMRWEKTEKIGAVGEIA